MAEKAGEVRRSARLNIYDSNGRDYLANSVGWSRKDLEAWIASPTVRPHLQLWHRICIGSPKRFNDAVEWINSGEQGYFYNPNDLEEDLLLMCLAEGEDSGVYTDGKTNTSKWITQELWARTAWRIVQANRSNGQAFAKYIEKHPAACYGFVIDILCVAFHSIAFRGAASVYASLIDGESVLEKSQYSRVPTMKHDDEETASTTSESTSASETSDDDSDEDFVDTDIQTPMTSENDDDSEVCKDSAHNWAEDTSKKDVAESDSTDLWLIDKDSLQITGYKRA